MNSINKNDALPWAISIPGVVDELTPDNVNPGTDYRTTPIYSQCDTLPLDGTLNIHGEDWMWAEYPLCYAQEMFMSMTNGVEDQNFILGELITGYDGLIQNKAIVLLMGYPT